MEQRVEFVLRALRAENFRALCLEYGIGAKTGYKWQERFLRFGMGEWKKNRAGPTAMRSNLGRQKSAR